MSRRFWNWQTPDPNSPNPDSGVRVLHINGPIAEESWFDDDVTPGLFASELNAGSGEVVIWLNSPGGDVVAAAQIYNMLIDYPAHVTVNIDGVAASAASVIAMAASTVAMSPVSMMMIHNPATLAVGDEAELGRAIDMLATVKESIINAYEVKTGLDRKRLAKLMDAETWMDARAAIDLGFADRLITNTKTVVVEVDEDAGGTEEGESGRATASGRGVVFSARNADRQLLNKITSHQPQPAPPQPEASGRRLVDLYADLTQRTK
ncbi:head maturation protease, ClpP-related [Actinomyces minihominis]|uniref:head maturation protease, ClpP-related n=1 Tax=Actinomyces minihominis TaxID=2002838 RepID=UPI001A90F583|nr:head maturation protease, ClpP-related [Actinomyces minihominis]